MMKTYQLSIKLRTQQRGRKGTRWKDPSPSKLRILQRGQMARGMRRNQVLEPSPPIARSILNKQRGGTLKRMFSLDEPSPIIITHLKIKVVYACYNATNTLYM
jgi:hypothetical protein